MKTDLQILATTVLHEGVPPGVNDPAASHIRRALEGWTKLGIAKGRVVTWPDGTWALLAFNPDWDTPRDEQLIRAYRTAASLGLRQINRST